MKLLLALLFSAAAALKHKPALAVRGGGAVGMVDEAFAQGLGRTAAGLTIGGAILEKYGGMDSNTITSAVSGEVFGTNAAIVFASRGRGAEGFFRERRPRRAPRRSAVQGVLAARRPRPFVEF